MTVKQASYFKCEEFLKNRLKVIQNTILDIQNALQSETKSSAGDKHETGRAMLQLECEKAGNQLAEIQKQRTVLNKVNPELQHQKAKLGSVVYTTQSNYFIAISAGKIVLDSKTFYAISPATPMAKLLISKVIDESVLFRASPIKITQIL